MDEHSELLGRVEKALGPAGATMFAERGRDRHFIFELTLTGVALYLLGKYIDGFIKGLGISDLGEKHGKAVAAAVERGLGAFTGENQQPDKEELEQHARAVSLTVVALRSYRSDPKGLAKGSSTLRALLEDQGIPLAEADRIAENIVEAVWHT